ncbi:hypothetical protein GH714_020397 [Hevea brasiliensis]|uniref:non-specific serine/threonine protein kinase n=1 Tax=Hevea brasiliensis TaxID=3981 RepID=A0A6A6N131_HEVBR|nr:hypothetical protein GH714_020397 [Hevea brasiliensis]
MDQSTKEYCLKKIKFLQSRNRPLVLIMSPMTTPRNSRMKFVYYHLCVIIKVHISSTFLERVMTRLQLLANKEKISSRKLLVMEFMPNGSLHEMLHVAQTPPSWPKRVEIALQIARAVQFLHENNPLVIHRDIKSANVLFDANWNAKLADYGLAMSSPFESLSHQASQPAGTIGYIDPCYTTPSKLSTKNDVFSYGVVLLEIISSRKAFDVSKAPASIVEWATPLIQKDRVPIKEICYPRIGLPPHMEGTIRHLLNVAARCVSSKEENRPSIGEIVMEMDSYCLVERVKVVAASPSSWTSLIRSLILMRRQRRLAKKYKRKCEDYSEISKGKLLLREILADT